MSDRDQGSRGGAPACEARVQVTGEPVHALDVEMVGGLVKDHDIGLRSQGGSQGHPSALAAGERRDVSVKVQIGQQSGVDIPHRGA